MPSTPTVESTLKRTLDRAVKSWNEFFFKPRDPTTLGLMRIAAGIFILYVHLAYTRDLYRFFGENGWADQKMAKESRQEYPFFTPVTSWYGNDTNLSVPLDRNVRRAVLLEWMQNLPSDPVRRREALNYLFFLPPNNPQDTDQGLAFVEQFVIRTGDGALRANIAEFVPTPEEERQKALNALTRARLTDSDKPLIPAFMHDLPKATRENLARSVLALAATMPKQPGDTALVFAHLRFQSFVPLSVRKPGQPRTELRRTMMFLIEQVDPNQPADAERGPFLPNSLDDRSKVLDYMNRWSVDPRRTYGQGQYIWSIWFHVTNPTMMAVIHVFFLIVMAMFAAGLWTRITSVITWLAMLSYMHRCNQVLFGMDTMMNIAMIYLMIGPSGAALSVDRWLEKRRARRELERARREKRDTSEWEALLEGPRPSVLANFVTRLVQIHFCFIYAASGLAKLKGPAWWNHTAMWSTVANPEFSPTVFQPYMWALLQISDVRWMAELFMSGGAVFTLFVEIGFPFLVWRPVLRPYMLMLAILLHTGIAVFMGLTVFSLFMLVLLMSYIPPETVKRWLELGERRLRREAAPPATAPQSATIAVAKT